MTSDLSVSELGQVIRRLQAKSLLRPAAGRAASLEETLGGTVEETDHGRVLLVRRRFDLDHRHGEQSLSGAGAIASGPLGLLARAGAPAAGGRLLYLDTETTGLAERIFQVLPDLLARGLQTIKSCSCRTGCPSCVGPVNEVGRRAKPVALALLRRLVAPLER